MGWNHPDIALEEMVKLTKGFVDILILASGYQSSGRLAHWDPQNIKKAFQWGLFFENVSIYMRECVPVGVCMLLDCWFYGISLGIS
jgi:hypothetical protein